MQQPNQKPAASARFFISSRDVELITGKTRTTASRMLQAARKSLGKLKHQPITIQEFCAYFGISEASLRNHLDTLMVVLLLDFHPNNYNHLL